MSAVSREHDGSHTPRMASGRRCSAVMDPRHYPKGVKPTKEQRAAIKIYEHTTLPKWGYTIGPHHRN